uniref:Uncharacterized protein n=1 Tax=Steinernema glaseri TaxID=37863 RepID=A0A1I7YXV6_9BILA
MRPQPVPAARSRFGKRRSGESEEAKKGQRRRRGGGSSLANGEAVPKSLNVIRRTRSPCGYTPETPEGAAVQQLEREKAANLTKMKTRKR